jgi:hypothetical protein
LNCANIFQNKEEGRIMERTMGKTVVILLVTILVASSMSLLLAQAQSKDPANFIVNPGFENGLTGWSTTEGPSAAYSVDSTTYHSGTHSCKGVEDNSEALGRLYQDVTSITSPGNQYQISGWIKTSNVTTGTVVIGLDYVDADGWTPEDGYVIEIGYVSGTLGWAFFQSPVFTLPSKPSDATALWFLFDFNNALGTAWWDDVSLASPGYIPAGPNVSAFPDPKISLTFEQVTQAGFATATTTTNYPPPPPSPEVAAAATATASTTSTPGFLGPVWDIKVTAKFTGRVTVGIDYSATGSVPLRMYQTDIILGDVNFDGKVNLVDLCIIIKALGSSPSSPKWNPNCDLNGDHKVDLRDLCIATHNFGKTSAWKDITYSVDSDHHIIYGITDHFSIFGVR